MIWTDSALIQLFLPIIKNGLIADGFNTVSVKQNYQPTMQGANTNPTLYFFKVASKRYGWLGRLDEWSTIDSEMVHTESQYFESMWQIMAMVTQNPATPDQFTASDLADEAASIMQSDNTRAILNDSGIGILRITDIINPYFTNDHDDYQSMPSFDFVLTGLNVREGTNPIISQFNSNIIGV
jgi:hypothetical protein